MNGIWSEECPDYNNNFFVWLSDLPILLWSFSKGVYCKSIFYKWYLLNFSLFLILEKVVCFYLSKKEKEIKKNIIILITSKKKEFPIPDIGNIHNDLNNYYSEEVFAFQTDSKNIKILVLYSLLCWKNVLLIVVLP